MVAMYCLYHGRQGLQNIATKIHTLTCDLAESKTRHFDDEKLPANIVSGLKADGNSINNELFFDTLKVQIQMSLNEIKQRAKEKRINLRYYEDGNVS